MKSLERERKRCRGFQRHFAPNAATVLEFDEWDFYCSGDYSAVAIVGDSLRQEVRV